MQLGDGKIGPMSKAPLPHRWDIYLARHTPAKWLGTVEAVTADEAIAVAVKEFGIEGKRLIGVRVLIGTVSACPNYNNSKRFVLAPAFTLTEWPQFAVEVAPTALGLGAWGRRSEPCSLGESGDVLSCPTAQSTLYLP